MVQHQENRNFQRTTFLSSPSDLFEGFSLFFKGKWAVSAWVDFFLKAGNLVWRTTFLNVKFS